MKPPVLQITLTLQAPGEWHYVARKRGELVACSDGESFDNPGKALMAAVAEIKAGLLPGQEGGDE
jgi:hypothetical protein